MRVETSIMADGSPIAQHCFEESSGTPPKFLVVLHGKSLAILTLWGKDATCISAEVLDDAFYEILPRSKENPYILSTFVNLIPQTSFLGSLLDVDNDRGKYWQRVKSEKDDETRLNEKASGRKTSFPSGLDIYMVTSDEDIESVRSMLKADRRKKIRHAEPIKFDDLHIYNGDIEETGENAVPKGLAGEKKTENNITSIIELEDTGDRISGKQMKIFCCVKNGQIHRAHLGCPPDVIYKVGELGGMEFAPLSEWFALRLWNSVVEDSPEHKAVFALVPQPNDYPPALAIQKFENDGWMMQDFLSLLGTNPQQNAHGQYDDASISYETMAKAMIDHANKIGVPEESTRKNIEMFCRNIAFSWLTCEPDLHPKNLSVYIKLDRETGEADMAITPGYDKNINVIESHINAETKQPLLDNHKGRGGKSYAQIIEFLNSPILREYLPSDFNPEQYLRDMAKTVADKTIDIQENMPVDILPKEEVAERFWKTDIGTGVTNILERAKAAGYDRTNDFSFPHGKSARKKCGSNARRIITNKVNIATFAALTAQIGREAERYTGRLIKNASLTA
ncbi:MAG: hypothetical protein CMH30_05005 [Micavibrio sp.]|nr:hypothetical protein [Micavibrio sp.]